MEVDVSEEKRSGLRRVPSASPCRTAVDPDTGGSRTPVMAGHEEKDGGEQEKAASESQDASSKGNDDARNEFLVSFDHMDPKNPRTFTNRRKWGILLIALALQAWANAISAMAAPSIRTISADLGIATTQGRVIQAIFLYGFAVGAVFLTPLSEDYGRLPTHFISVLLLAIFQIPCALAPNYATMLVFRFLGGFFAATTFNSVGIISDMWEPEHQGWPVNGFALSAEMGAEVGTVIGGYIYVGAGWRWVFGVAGIVTAFLLVVFIAVVPETRSGVILKKRAKQRRAETGDDRYFAHHEIALQHRTIYNILQESLFRPLYMLVREPIVLWFALFDGFNYAIIYLALESIPLIYSQWEFSEGALELPFLGMFTGSVIAFCLYYFQLRWEDKEAQRNNGIKPPESRLLWMIPGGILFPASLFWFAWTTQGPPIPWIVSVLALGMFGLSSHIIFISVSDYTIASYSIYSASAVGAQSLLREILSGSVTLFASPLYVNLGYQWASTLLAFIAVLLAFVPPILYFFGPRIRAASAFALEIQKAEEDAKKDARHAKDVYDQSQAQSTRPSIGEAEPASTQGADKKEQEAPIAASNIDVEKQQDQDKQ